MSLTIQEKMIYQRVRKAAILWLLMLRLDPEPLTEKLASEILQIDRSTARGYLKTLSEMGIATRLGRFSGFTLTDSGKQLSLPLELRTIASGAEGGNSPLDPLNVNESLNHLKDLTTLNTSLTLIKSEGGISSIEGGISSLAAQPVDKTPIPVDKPIQPVENHGIDINELVDQILIDNPEKKEILNALLFCRISMNFRTVNLLFSDEITVEEIKAQYSQLEKRELANQTGLLITNLEAKYKPRGADFDSDTGHPLECACWECIGARNKRILANHQETGKAYTSWNDSHE